MYAGIAKALLTSSCAMAPGVVELNSITAADTKTWLTFIFVRSVFVVDMIYSWWR